MAAVQTPPFGIILPSRPVEATPTVLSSTQYAFTLPSSPPFSHIVAFLLPGTTLPQDTLAGVYVQLPGSAPDFKFLGALANDKHSAIFRVNDGSYGGQSTSDGMDQDEMTDIDANPVQGASSTGNITIGISIEPAASIQSQLSTLKTTNADTSTTIVLSPKSQRAIPLTTKVLAQRIIQNAFNFLASFSGTVGAGGEEMVPLKSFKAWWEKFERRVEMDPGFLEKDGDA